MNAHNDPADNPHGERQLAESVFDIVKDFAVEGVGEPLSDEDFVRAYVRRYNWGWSDPIPGVVSGYGVYDDDEDDPPIFECHMVEDAQELVRVMRWLREHFARTDGDGCGPDPHKTFEEQL